MKFTGISTLLCLMVFEIHAQPQQEEPSFRFLPPGLNFAPLKANIQEPRIGVFKFLDASAMKVDIGNSIDIFEYKILSPDLRFTVGIDFMAYAYTVGTQGLRLQIDAIDGFFGGNMSCTKLLDRDQLHARLRILHHSAHFVDGHFITVSNSWANNRPPIPFTQDFGELVIAHSIFPSYGTLRYYGGISYATLVRPTSIQRFSYLAGVETGKLLSSSLFNRPAYIYAAYNATLTGTPEYAASHQLQIGIKFGELYEKGPSLYLAYYTGRQMFGEYFDELVTTIGAGFTVDFF
jgi:hypothetical protein